MNPEIKRELILDNYNNPTNKGLLNDDNYLKIDKNNESCIDHFKIELKLNGDKIEDIRFDGESCAIATSSLSISIGLLLGKTKEEALNIIDNYEKMINGEDYDKDVIEELIVYEDTHKQPARKKCATLGILGIKELLEK